MSIFRVVHDKTNPYFMLNRAAVNDDRLSFKAVGILTYLLSKPDNWTVREEDLAARHTEGTFAVRSGLRELRDAGYMVYTVIRDEHGRLGGTEVHVYETPQKIEKTLENNQNVGNPHLGITEPSETHASVLPRLGSPTPRESTPIVSNEKLLSTEDLEIKEQSELSDSADDTRGPDKSNLFDMKDTKSEKPRTFSRQQAERLHTALIGKSKLTRRANLDKWSEEITTFGRNSGVNKPRFEKVLSWYIDHIGEEFVPEAFCAASFCEKFVRIESQMKRPQTKKPSINNFDIVREKIRNGSIVL